MATGKTYKPTLGAQTLEGEPQVKLENISISMPIDLDKLQGIEVDTLGLLTYNATTKTWDLTNTTGDAIASVNGVPLPTSTLMANIVAAIDGLVGGTSWR